MRKSLIVSLAFCLYNVTASAAPAPQGFEVPATCKNLALMETAFLDTHFNDGSFAAPKYNPPSLTLKTDSGFDIGKIEYLGGDSEDQDGPNAGTYPCDTTPGLCTRIPDAGGAFDWARLTVKTRPTADDPGYDVAEVVVSMGSRGGCVVESADWIAQF